jgi:hypothetical protein
MFELKKLNVHRIVGSKEEADKLKAQGFEELSADVQPDFTVMKVDELKAYAEGKGIDLGEATKKDDIITKLKAGK